MIFYKCEIVKKSEILVLSQLQLLCWTIKLYWKSVTDRDILLALIIIILRVHALTTHYSLHCISCPRMNAYG